MHMQRTRSLTMRRPEAHAVTARAAESRDEASRSLENQPRHNQATVVS